MNKRIKVYPWSPIPGLSENYYIHSVCNDENGFQVILVEVGQNTKKVYITFPFGVRSYRATDELLSINALQVNEDIDTLNSQESWSLFKVINSEYLTWASKRSDGVSDHLKLIHFAICTQDWTLEILDNAEPNVKIVNIE